MTRDKESLPNTILWFSVRILLNIILIFILVEGFYGGYQFTDKLFDDNPYVAGSTRMVDVSVGQGESALQIADKLETDGIVDGKYLFLARVYIGKYHNRIKAGIYKVGPGMSPDEICRAICGIKSEEES